MIAQAVSDESAVGLIAGIFGLTGLAFVAIVAILTWLVKRAFRK
jgi:hypothetical protein